MKAVPSFTAETMALQRSFESHRPKGRRLFCDPYAEAFLRPSLRALATASGIPGLRRLAVGLYDAVGGPGPRPSAIVRTKVIDDAVIAATTDGAQCVLLGAGYDTRAYRLPALKDHRVFEVDQPITQTAKHLVVDRLGLDGRHVTYVPIDFEHDRLADSLLTAGFDPVVRSIFVWEGVTNYLTGEAVDATLAVVHDLTTRGGVLILTYVDARALTDPSPFPEARRWVRAVARAGEPWIFGLDPADASQYFADRGFLLRQDDSTLDAGRAWLTAQGRSESGSGLYRIAILEPEHKDRD